MLSVISVGSLKASGSATVALTLASVAAAADIPVVLIDAAGQGELAGWAAKAAHPAHLSYEQAADIAAIERALRQARRSGAVAIIDAGEDEATVRAAAGLADRALIPVRFSPISAYSALVTDQMLAADARRDRKAGDRCFVASAITVIGSGVARSIEAIIGTSGTPRLPIGLSQCAAHAAPFALGGTIFTLDDVAAAGLERARVEAARFAQAVGILGAAVESPPVRRFEAQRQAA
ncbi:chromosome partitioning protein ParA [Aurantimonas aggregata]|uniref:Chromosome partitioning protein ParA n=1 Tax=Aurantimonas aggregata TaxID=2047720 RepID=A0A6L9MDW7_9HYPH|nr:chromosome partitioning protein ParA [Aurantimonas aggregata]NDV85851.1 chromosome partitioning protein ParA [Aurantimonas aggregata]